MLDGRNCEAAFGNNLPQFLYTFSEIASGNYTQTHLHIVQENLENTF